ncbi:LysR family transcriptional regulator [Marinomonas transparens]|uniref:LysR family transcriptional regulator n=1 Tax=Marinomonas transparens TaxID=2795388 RepID=A0A934JTL5_9GAMM|nr:LysR family transcriptional regulator [Marinomonas transparens]MBJ7537079.1 LysR family transcriptional regulator [Marinomonas transparens]
MIDSIFDMKVFTTVVTTGSQTAAANKLDVSLAVVSKRIASLEKHLKLRLLNRTTRNQSLTSEGQVFYEHCTRILNEVEKAELSLTQAKSEVAGLLSVTAPRIFGQNYVVPLLTSFKKLHPDLQVRLILSDKNVDLVASGIDIAFRFGELNESTMLSRKLVSNSKVFCASPSYIKSYGLPKELIDLENHSCILYGKNPKQQWDIHQHDSHLSVRINAAYSVNEGDTALSFALEGAGILFKSIWDVRQHIAEGRLAIVLPEYSSLAGNINIVIASSKQLIPRVRKFIDHAEVSLHSIVKS